MIRKTWMATTASKARVEEGYVHEMGKQECNYNSIQSTSRGGLCTQNETDDEDSTLFELNISESTNDTQVIFRVRHVNNNLYLRPDNDIDGSDAVLCAVKSDPDPYIMDLFTVIGRSLS